MRIAILEDDEDQAARVRLLLESAGHSVHLYSRGRPLLAKLAHESYDLLIVDWEVPDISGYDVLRTARSQLLTATPILFLTHRDSEYDIVQALEAGADDFIVKPPRDREFLARVNALIRRARPDVGQRIDSPPFSIDLDKSIITKDGVPIDLTRREYEVALFFFRNLGKVVSRSHILESVWGRGGDVTTRTVDTHVSRLRVALGLSSASGVRLTPVYGYGYRLETVNREATE
jgi:two-component system, OmpR family, response regulator RegX3